MLPNAAEYMGQVNSSARKVFIMTSGND